MSWTSKKCTVILLANLGLGVIVSTLERWYSEGYDIYVMKFTKGKNFPNDLPDTAVTPVNTPVHYTF